MTCNYKYQSIIYKAIPNEYLFKSQLYYQIDTLDDLRLATETNRCTMPKEIDK